MIDYLNGPVAELNPTAAVVECGGVGYDVNITLMDFSALQGKASAKLYVHECPNVREGTTELYGFLSRRAREIFALLISVSGCGANSARLILSSLTPADVENVVATGQASMLKAVKGIGPKTAERIIVDLRDKIKASGDALITQASTASQTRDEAIQALVMLGFAKPQTEKAVARLLRDNPTSSVEELIKSALKML